MDVVLVPSGLSGVSYSFSDDFLSTNLYHNPSLNVAGFTTSSDYGEQVYLLRGERTGFVSPRKESELGSQRDGPVYSIEIIIPGPIANIDYGIRIGREESTINVPRIYPPIYIEPRSRNA